LISQDFSQISGDKVFLRKFNLSDAAKIFQMSIEPGMKQWIPDQVYQDLNESEEVLRFLIEQYDSPDGPKAVPVVFGICLHETGELIGHAGLSPLDGQVEIGYAIEEIQQKKGYASDAIAAICKWAAGFYRLPNISGIVAADNPASCRVLEKAGFTFIEAAERTMHGKMRLVRIYRFSPESP